VKARGAVEGLIAKRIPFLRYSKMAVNLLTFVLGHPEYYPRHGFKKASILGFDVPYPIPQEHADAWMVQELRSGVIGNVSGKVQCSDVLNQPEH
jgi:putative acetyltransferase